ncbi:MULTISPECIES: hypothetical protein [Lachnospiraceae]|jgi:hypothetical protein|uniref:DUF3784 domain-containing protein n=1 Tax=Faecalicatena acetigenes TaxID=2981790 RepID=A0ABT2T871_9FIRM|nr:MULTISPECIES: hypothetical protein [Lachnospiraceae]MCU6746112.1 hypothetical protein [Faecalicatena acetigenes]RGT74964.1 hypothetical protein DWX08_00440 [Ruminococcus sp. AF18-22]SCG95919.1 Uncharacterised protein [uncultured Clostridium sp.]
MLALLGAFGICFILRGAFMFAGRGIPKGVLERLSDKEQLRGWYRGTGSVHILWGVCAVLLWCANTFSAISIYALIAVVICAVSSIIISCKTTYTYSRTS